MKKTVSTLFIMLIFICSSAFAQPLKLYTTDNVDVTTSSIHVYGSWDSDGMELPLNVKNNSGSQGDFKVKKTEISLVEYAAVGFCWGTCYSAYDFVSAAETFNTSETKNSFFIADYWPIFTEGTSDILYTFFDSNNPSDSIAIHIYFTTAMDGVSNVVITDNGAAIAETQQEAATAIYPNPANENTTYTYSISNNFSTAVFTITNLLGEKIAEYPVNTQEGTININTEDVNAGIYVGSLIVDGKATSIEKLVVKH